MLVFEYVLILLAAVLLSNLINRFVPVLSAPILQIVLGAAVALIPFGAFGFEFDLEPELFFVLFIAPLVFYTSMTADKKTLWDMKSPILGSAVILVVITVLTVGYALHAIVPIIPLSAAFVLNAALSPTDDVAVSAVGKRVAIPQKIMGILSGESIINDASGIVCFQFAIAAAVTGSFSIAKATGQFLLVGLGGILAGLAFTLLKYALVKWLRSLGIENVTLHILIGLLTPFIIYMAAERLGVSGILAVFAAGVSHSFARVQLNPETVSLNTALESMWSMLAFTFEGIVFVMLGTQLPGILKTIEKHSIGGWQIAGCVLLLTLVFAALRFVWWILAIRKKTYQDQGKIIGRIKSGVIFSLAGARGTVTLASVMSIPLMLTDGNLFPVRDLIILLASGVIVVSLLITNFLLPLFVERKAEQGKNQSESEAYAEIIQRVMTRLLSEATEENRAATLTVVRSYYERNAASMGENLRLETTEAKKLKRQVFIWEKENTTALLENGVVPEAVAKHFIEFLDTRIQSERNERFFQKFTWLINKLHRFNHLKSEKNTRNDFFKLLTANSLFVLEKLNKIRNNENADAVDKLISSYELTAAFHMGGGWEKERIANAEAAESLIYQVASKGFHMERGLIHEMFEAGRISRETAKEMRGNIAALEARFQMG
ncbi:MAG: Na+/H+ antiporter [Holophagales bacterium]|jgi:CPA1 family monovalent cation:H+ antiporter|nr:Na+/H+ antiporter [Holophagales bacterium]